MTSATDHGRTLLAAIIPNRTDLLDVALRLLEPHHFTDHIQRAMFELLERYYDQTGAVLPRTVLADLLRNQRGHNAANLLAYQEMYDLLAATQAGDADFRWSLRQLRDLAAERATYEALTGSMEILTRGIQNTAGEYLRGHTEARHHLLNRLAEIDRSLSLQDAPEGDMRAERDDILADYAARKAARLSGASLGIQFGIPLLDAKVGGIHTGDLVLLAGWTSDGKALALRAPVLTPSGWRRMGDLKVGDELADPNGAPSQVTGVYPQGVRPVYRLTFSDGSSAEATGDHLWAVRLWTNGRERRTQPGGRGQQSYERRTHVLTTDQLRERLARKHRAITLVPAPALATLDFPEQPLPIDPYLLGVLLGDGCLVNGTPTLTNPDAEIAAGIRGALPEGAVMAQRQTTAGKCPTYSFSGDGKSNPLTAALRDLGIWGRHSYDKFVPEPYKWASAKTRLAILQGLMDTDGGHERGRATFSSASERLRDDVVWLARSLGLRAAPMKDKIPTYTYRGERRQGRPTYRCSVWETEDVRVFRLPRKIKPLPSRDAGRALVSVEYVRDEECQCISVSAPSRLYVTEDFIPTHNTSLCVQLAWHAAVRQAKNVVILTTETVRGTVRRRLVARHSVLEHFGIPGGINSRDLRNGTLPDTLEPKYAEVVADITTNPGYGRIYIVQVPRSADMAYIESKMFRIQRMFDIDLCIMDYLALLKSERRRNSDREELSNTLKAAKQLATTFNDGTGVPFVSPWQVSRLARAEANRSGMYDPSALSETAEAANSADLIIGLLAPTDNDSRVTNVKLQLMKHRDGEKASSLECQVDYATSHFYAADAAPIRRPMTADSFF